MGIIEPLKTFELGSKASVAITAKSSLDWRRQGLQAERPVGRWLQKGPNSGPKEQELADIAAGRTESL